MIHHHWDLDGTIRPQVCCLFARHRRNVTLEFSDGSADFPNWTFQFIMVYQCWRWSAQDLRNVQIFWISWWLPVEKRSPNSAATATPNLQTSSGILFRHLQKVSGFQPWNYIAWGSIFREDRWSAYFLFKCPDLRETLDSCESSLPVQLKN